MRVQVYVDGEPQGTEVNLISGDSVTYVATGNRLAISTAEQQIEDLKQRQSKMVDEYSKLLKTMEEMADAPSIEAAVGIAWKAGYLRDEGDDW